MTRGASGDCSTLLRTVGWLVFRPLRRNNRRVHPLGVRIVRRSAGLPPDAIELVLAYFILGDGVNGDRNAWSFGLVGGDARGSGPAVWRDDRRIQPLGVRIIRRGTRFPPCTVVFILVDIVLEGQIDHDGVARPAGCDLDGFHSSLLSLRLLQTAGSLHPASDPRSEC